MSLRVSAAIKASESGCRLGVVIVRDAQVVLPVSMLVLLCSRGASVCNDSETPEYPYVVPNAIGNVLFLTGHRVSRPSKERKIAPTFGKAVGSFRLICLDTLMSSIRAVALDLKLPTVFR